MLEDELGPCTPAGANPMPQLISWFALDAAQLPVEDWPWIMVVGRETPALTMVESIPEGDAYDVTYNVRAYAYVRGDGYEGTSSLRSRVTLGIREIALTKPTLGDTGARIDVPSLRESYSELDEIELLGTIAASYVDLRVIAREVVRTDIPPYGRARTIAVTVRRLPTPSPEGS
ncbi:hypothetical protein [Microbispora triticiradicis]|nr:hypothetical protein [Microbispora triticiradicis]